MTHLTVLAAILVLFGSHVTALKRDLHIVNANIAPDGFERAAVLAEGVFPGPLLAVNKNERFQLNVIDELNDTTMAIDTSIHWHGLFQHHTAYADGPAFVTQCPIVPNHSFLYDFRATGQTGTYWYHSHYKLQYCDGLRGPLVIYDPQDPLMYLYDIDDESTVMTLADWYHAPASQIPGPGLVPSTLINGLGRSTTNLTTPLAIVNVVKGKRYRLRLINISCEPMYNLTIDGHTFTVIEADGVETEPLEVDLISIFAAQRYSFILNANQPINNYWIRALPSEGLNLTFIGGQNSAILRYAGAKEVEPTTTQMPSINPLVETNLHPLIPSPVPGGKAVGEVDKAINLIFNFTGTNFTIDNVAFDPPTVPVLLQILSGEHNAQELMPAGSVHPLPPYSSIEISMPGGVIGGGHPLHLHGHNFHVIRSAGNSSYNFDNPVIRDTVNIGVLGDNATIRFETNNPGPWFFHCHIDFHLNLGFAAVFAEDIPQIKANSPVPLSWKELCPIFNSTNN